MTVLLKAFCISSICFRYLQEAEVTPEYHFHGSVAAGSGGGGLTSDLAAPDSDH